MQEDCLRDLRLKDSLVQHTPAVQEACEVLTGLRWFTQTAESISSFAKFPTFNTSINRSQRKLTEGALAVNHFPIQLNLMQK